MTREEWQEAFDEADLESEIRRYLHAELFNAAFGIEARYEILAAGDPQIRRALEAFDEAGDLLARRQALERTSTDNSEDGSGVFN